MEIFTPFPNIPGQIIHPDLRAGIDLVIPHPRLPYTEQHLRLRDRYKLHPQTVHPKPFLRGASQSLPPLLLLLRRQLRRAILAAASRFHKMLAAEVAPPAALALERVRLGSALPARRTFLIPGRAGSSQQTAASRHSKSITGQRILPKREVSTPLSKPAALGQDSRLKLEKPSWLFDIVPRPMSHYL